MVSGVRARAPAAEPEPQPEACRGEGCVVCACRARPGGDAPQPPTKAPPPRPDRGWTPCLAFAHAVSVILGDSVA